ncbi:MAG: SRPBCC domain-containing protein [Ignavibacteriaceae bacterium]|nr:SRPBCC domain-containing protein [Ignavibacteriaceae bacterium]
MSEEKNVSGQKKLGEIVITRFFEGSRDLVWKVWTEPDLIKRWWGPKYFTAPFCKIDFRVGGVALYCMRSPEGKDYWSTGIYREIIMPSRIVCTDSFADEKGNVVPASYYGMSSELPLEMLWNVTFEDIKGNTKFTLRHSGLLKGSMSDLTYQGWNESLDKFAETLKYSLVGIPKT